MIADRLPHLTLATDPTMRLSTSDFLLGLRDRFVAAGFDLRDVGGSVRDALRGDAPKDRDFCTDADPNRQIAIYRDNCYRYVETGLPHGTLTVVDPDGGGSFEITSLRLETDHDGRHATVSYTDDWVADLARRDLTINAMALDFEGNLFDPFGGAADLSAGVVRFVGEPDARIREDYLRILRYFRFLGRYGRHSPEADRVDADSLAAIARNAPGLARISVERVWSEMRRILVGPRADTVLRLMLETGTSKAIGLSGTPSEVVSTNPVTQLAKVAGADVLRLSEDWKMSGADRRLAEYLALVDPGADLRRELAVNRTPRDFVVELAKLTGRLDDLRDVQDWEVPAFPVTGRHLAEAGHEPGPAFTVLLHDMRNRWADSGYVATKDDLLEAGQACSP